MRDHKKAKVDYYAEELRVNQTNAEKVFKNILDSSGVEYLEQKPIYFSRLGWIIPDFTLKYSKVLIEIDGEYHYKKHQLKKDRFRDTVVRSERWTVLRINNKKVSDSKIIDRLKSIIENRRIEDSRKTFDPTPKVIPPKNLL